MSVGQLVHPSVSLSVSPSVGPLVRATHVTFPNFKISLGQIKSREVNSSHFYLGMVMVLMKKWTKKGSL